MNDTVSFKSNGLIDPLCITTIGVSVNESENPIGFFGTGLKYAIAIRQRPLTKDSEMNKQAELLIKQLRDVNPSANPFAASRLMERAANELRALIDAVQGLESEYSKLSAEASPHMGPCSCQDFGKCRYVNGVPACMNEAESQKA